MATNSLKSGCAVPTRKLDDLKQLLWGAEIRDDVFQRWNQGFAFSEDESSALMQHDGGPCAVIVPVQAFLLKNLLFTSATKENWRLTTGADRNRALCQAFADILKQMSSPDLVTLVYCEGDLPCHRIAQSDTAASPSGDQLPEDVNRAAVYVRQDVHAPGAEAAAGTVGNDQMTDDSSSSPKRQRFSHERFHADLRNICLCLKDRDLAVELDHFLPVFYGDHGVLLFLYSILLTKGLDQIKKEMADLGEALIDSTHGHGSQSLINLLITGKAVPHVWDNEMDVSGLKLQGISSKSSIGFLTLLEHFRYCEVGWHLKNPLYPIWLLGSETHLTVLFSEDKTLVGEESNEDFARRMFSSFDKEGNEEVGRCVALYEVHGLTETLRGGSKVTTPNHDRKEWSSTYHAYLTETASGRGFINVDSLGPLMKLLSLVSMPEYVNIMAEKLDPEQLGVITLNSFLEEFYSNDKPNHDAVHTFIVYHYNGLPRSSLNNKVQYSEAKCAIMDMPEVQMISDFSQIKSCLLTKWPTIELTWKNDTIPSLN